LGCNAHRAWALLILVSAGTPACQAERASYAAARDVVKRHCLSCHSRKNSEVAFPIAPGGVVFDTPADMRRFAERIRARAAIERTMPLLNKTGITDEERALLARWVEQGAAIAD
jgi:uncharacterized membrane protein